MRRGIFGGTFDPIHCGHIYVIASSFEKLDLDYLHVLVAGNPYQKGAVTNSRMRLDWVTKSIHEYFGTSQTVLVDDREVKREGPTYTIDTIMQYKQEYESDELVLILGEDTYESISSWKDSDKIEELCEISRVNREDFKVSSTQIRELASKNKAITGLVPKCVEAIIKESKVYN